MTRLLLAIAFHACLTGFALTPYLQGQENPEPAPPSASDLDGDWIWYGPGGIGELTFADGRQNFQLVRNDGSRPWAFETAIEVSSHEGISLLVHRNEAGEVTYRGVFKLMDGHFNEIPPQIRAGARRAPELRDWRRVGDAIDGWLASARLGKTSEVKRLLDEGMSPDSTVGDSLTALAYASAGGHLETMKLLIERGSDVNLRSGYWGHSAIDEAVIFEHPDAVKLLLEHGASLKPRQPIGHTGVRNYRGQSPLHELAMSGNATCLDVLLENGADINARNLSDQTPLMSAVYRARQWNREVSDKHIQMVQTLLSKKADKTLKNKDGMTALDIAKSRNLEALYESLKP